MSTIVDGEKYLHEEEVLDRTQVSKATLYIKMKYENFPRPLKQRRIWKESEIEAYLKKVRRRSDIKETKK